MRQLEIGQILKIGQGHAPEADFAQDVYVLEAPTDNQHAALNIDSL
jgi:hypothetical protein